MRRYRLLAWTTIIIVTALILAGTANAQYWFQSGARGSSDAGFNSGASVSIRTVYQNATVGSLGYWVGEDLSNGAFIQVGYEITNSSGYYSSSCGNSTKNVFLNAGTPTWFWEYFRPNDNNNSFCGGIGPNGSAGLNGSFNTYSFKANGSVWSTYFNNQLIGSVNLGTTNSGPNPPSAFSEYAETNTNTWPMSTVVFKNLIYYIGDLSRLVPQGYSSVGYGKGSLTVLANPYGVQEVGNFINNFEVGSTIPVQSSTVLWHVGYTLKVSSNFGNVTGSGNYIAYAIVPLSIPRIVNISPGVRELFTGWQGTGPQSYSGNNTNPFITLYGNITETATWKKQYYLNATTQYGHLGGAGWYDVNSSATVFASPALVNTGAGSRVVFDGWSNNASQNTTTVYMNAPKSIAVVWQKQYHLNVSAQQGAAFGSGWYDANSSANISVNTAIVPINSTSRLAFSGWSNGAQESHASVFMNSPISVTATFGKQYLVNLAPENSYGQNITSVKYYNISSNNYNSSSVFLFANRVYNIEYLYYKGVLVATNQKFIITAPSTVKFKTPIYNVQIYTQSVFDTPINATVNIAFKNNTHASFYSGNNGTQNFYNVPYGYVSGYADYLGFRETINVQNGESSYLTFITSTLVALIVGGIILIAAIARIVTYYEEKRKKAKTSR